MQWNSKKLFLGGIVFWYWIVSFLVLNILGIVNKNNPIMLRPEISTLEVSKGLSTLQTSVCPFCYPLIHTLVFDFPPLAEECSNSTAANMIRQKNCLVFNIIQDQVFDAMCSERNLRNNYIASSMLRIQLRRGEHFVNGGRCIFSDVCRYLLF